MRKLCVFAVPFVAAVFGAVYLLPLGALLWLAGLCAAAGLVCACWRGKVDRLPLVLVCVGLATGFLWSWGHDALFFAPARLLDGQKREVFATVTQWPQENEQGTAVQVTLQLEGAVDPQAILYLDGAYTDWKPGDGVACTVTLRRADLRYGEESDYYRARGISLLAYGDGVPTHIAAAAVPPRYWPLVVARAMKESVARVFPADTVGFMTALITGDKTQLGGEVYSAMQRTGMAHIVAVSGLHVSFLAGLLTALLGKRRRLGVGVTMGVLLFFAAVAGNSPSVLRAVYLQSALMVAPLLGRESDKATSLSTVLMLLLMWNPGAAASVSLQLSFAAVAGIYLVTGRLNRRWTEPWGRGLWHKLLRLLAGSLSVSVGALVFAAPLLAYYYGTISLVAPLANVLALWAVSAAFMGGLVAAVMGLWLPAVGGALAWAVSWLLRFVEGVALLLARIPFVAMPADGYFGLWLGFAYVLLLVWVLWRGEKKRVPIALAACAVTLCGAFLLHNLTLHGGDLRVTLLDVGQGASTLLLSKGQTALIDCGGSGADNPGDVAADAVQRAGGSTLDYLILTHFHDDHAKGVERLFARLKVNILLIPDVEPDAPLRAEILALAQAEGCEVRFVMDDTWVPLGETALTLYAPLGDGGANEEGLSVLATCGSFDALITGDMNATVERRLVKYGNLPDLELLAVGHHGSRYSSSEELLRATRPEYATISVGYNSYGHPSPEALERLAAAGCEIYRTDLQGTVTITAGGS